MKIIPLTKSVPPPTAVVEKNLNKTNLREIITLHKRCKSNHLAQEHLLRFFLCFSIVARDKEEALVEQYTKAYNRGDLVSKSKITDAAKIKQEVFDNFFTDGYKFTGGDDDLLGDNFRLADINENLTDNNLRKIAVVWSKPGLIKPPGRDILVLSEGAEDNEEAEDELLPSSSSSSSSAKKVVIRKKERLIELPWRTRPNDENGNRRPDGVVIYPEFVLQPTVVSASVRSIVQPTHA